MATQPQTHVYKTVGDCEIKVDVYRPTTGSPPVGILVNLHGGALINCCRCDMDARHLGLYLDAGYLVVSPDYRLAPETKLPAIIEDMQDAFAWIRKAGPDVYGADPQRLAVIGHSAGGYLALMSGFCVTPRPKAIISFYGYGDIIGDWYGKPDPFYCAQPAVSEAESGRLIDGRVLSEPYEGRGKEKFYLYCRQNGLWPLEVAGHDPHEEPDFFTPYCPLQNVTPDYPPTLLAHGQDDTAVPHEQSRLMAEELARQKVTHEFISMPGFGHGMGFDEDMDDPKIQAIFDRVVTFLGEHTLTEVSP